MLCPQKAINSGILALDRGDQLSYSPDREKGISTIDSVRLSDFVLRHFASVGRLSLLIVLETQHENTNIRSWQDGHHGHLV